MKSTKRVTVLLALYKPQEGYLEQQLQSIEREDYESFEGLTGDKPEPLNT